MLLDLSHSLEVLSHHGVKLVGNKLGVAGISGVVLSVEEPLGDVVVGGSGDDVRDLLDLVVGDLTSSLVAVDLGNLEGEERESSSETSDLSEAERSLLFTVQVSVLDTKNVLEVVRVSDY